MRSSMMNSKVRRDGGKRPTRQGRKHERFYLQPTRSFPEGAPQREEYYTDKAHEEACEAYAAEWRAEYECPGCDVKPPAKHSLDCPERDR